MSEVRDLYFGVNDPEVAVIKKQLVALGYEIYDMGNAFDIATHVAVQKFQESRGLTIDGWVGPVTRAKIAEAKPTDKVTVPDRVVVVPKPVTEAPPTKVVAGDWYGAIWLGWAAKTLGYTEFTHDAFFAKYWKYSGLNYTSVIGTRNAWCALFINASFHEVGIKGTGSAAAATTRTYGVPTVPATDWWFGCPIHIIHAGGGNHTTFFLYWVDKAKGLAACLGGNQGNSVNITIYRIAPGYEKCPGGPRWPKGHPPGRVVTEAEGKKLFKDAGYSVGGSTR